MLHDGTHMRSRQIKEVALAMRLGGGACFLLSIV